MNRACARASPEVLRLPTPRNTYRHSGAADAGKRARRRLGCLGLDCAEEVSVLRLAVGPLVGGADRLAFDILNGRMTIAKEARDVPEHAIVEAVAATGMKAVPWTNQRAENGICASATAAPTMRAFTTSLDCTGFSGGYSCRELRCNPGLLKGCVVIRFRFGWRNVADRLQQSAVVEPVHPLHLQPHPPQPQRIADDAD